MKEEEIRFMDGTTGTRLIPENADDVAEIHRMKDTGEIDARESFGDDPELWERLKAERRGVEPRRKEYVIINGVLTLQDAPSDKI
jgi:hypothetical protein